MSYWTAYCAAISSCLLFRSDDQQGNLESSLAAAILLVAVGIGGDLTCRQFGAQVQNTQVLLVCGGGWAGHIVDLLLARKSFFVRLFSFSRTSVGSASRDKAIRLH